MPRYANRSGMSSVYAYSIHSKSIDVEFQNGQAYTYSYDFAGEDVVETMKTLAKAGRGLNSFIKAFANDLYDI